MHRIVLILLVVTLTVSACGRVRESNINPFNWFGGSRDEPARTTAENDNPLIPRQERGGFFGNRDDEEYQGEPVNRVAELSIERLPGGALIRATGVSEFQNVFEVQLTRVGEGPVDGVLDYRLEARIPERPISGGPERLRTVVAARSLTDQDLEGVRTIRVTAQENARSSDRR